MTVKEFINNNPLENISIYRHNAQINEWDRCSFVLSAQISNIDSDTETGEIFIEID